MSVTSEIVDSSSRPRSWWRFRLSLRSSLILILILGFPLAWQARRASIQRRAVAKVQALGGQVFYEDETNARGVPRRPHRPWGPRWLRDLIGDEFFGEVAWVNFDSRRSRRSVADESITVLNDFARFQELTIRASRSPSGEPPTRLVTATGLARLTALSRLRVLHLYDVGTDAAMMALLPLWPALEDVTVMDSTKTLPDDHLAQLAALTQPGTMSLVDNAALTDRSVIQLRSFPALEYLTIRQPAVSPATLDALRASWLRFNIFKPPDGLSE